MALHFEGVDKWFPSVEGASVQVLKRVNLAAEAGQFWVFRGPNGCGKTTLMNLAAGLDEPSNGIVRLAEERVDQTVVGYLFQDYAGSLLPWLTLGENATLPLKLKGISRAMRRESLVAISEETGLTGLPFDRYPFQCSGGQQQKTCFLRSLLASERFLILDEPFASLDRESCEKVTDMLQRIRLAGSHLVLLVIHDLDDAIFLADRLVCLDGSPATIRDIVPVDLPWPRKAEVRVRSEFLDVRRRVLDSSGELHR
ncbi:MAG TPA: ABC transporter ATP-binding protein [Blastocatellia bacterium]|nr:ABC transporter ATP-binding protein [Blastocatellia bacterium]